MATLFLVPIFTKKSAKIPHLKLFSVLSLILLFISYYKHILRIVVKKNRNYFAAIILYQ
jgi:hypothetical protein